MYLLYSMLLIVWGVALLPVFLYKAWRQKKTLPGIKQRMGRLPYDLKHDGRPVVWFHACSVGEALSLRPLVQTLRQSFPAARFVFSTVTKTGQEMVVQNFGAENTFYFPADFAFVIRRVLDWIRPAMIVIVDTEIWPNLLNQSRRRDIPVVLANGRISPRSFRWYRLARPFLRAVFQNYAALMAQSEDDAFRLAGMGAPPEMIKVTGNLKFDRHPAAAESGGRLPHTVDEAFNLEPSAAPSPLIVAGSTHPGEERILISVLKKIRNLPALAATRLLIAPRHPERFDEVLGLVVKEGFTAKRRTDCGAAEPDAEVLILDTVGELAEAYRYGAVAFVGGTLTRNGGHSVLEPALFSKAIVVGPYTDNFRAIIDEFLARGAIRRIGAGDKNPELQERQLSDIFAQLLQNAEERTALGKAAHAVLERNRGAARRAGETIAALLMKRMSCQPE